MRKWLSNTWNLINSFIEIEILSKRLSLRDSITPVIFWQLRIRYIMYWRQLHTTYMNKASNSYLTQQTWLLHCLLHLPGPSSASAESTKTPTQQMGIMSLCHVYPPTPHWLSSPTVCRLRTVHNVTLSRVPTHATLTVISDGHNVTLSRVPTHATLTVISHCMQATHSS